ncbi:unnamed protein product [Closterium sp. Naga37s-1]|nr:unnamed protein product [Closterium sp. Naga37s-1]
MGKREDNDSTNLPLVKVGRFGRVTVAEQGAEDRDAAAYKRLMALMKEEARPIGYLHGRGALDHDDLNYLREHIRAEEETEKLRQHSEKRAFAALKICPFAAFTFGAATAVRPVLVPLNISSLPSFAVFHSMFELMVQHPRVTAHSHQHWPALQVPPQHHLKHLSPTGKSHFLKQLLK